MRLGSLLLWDMQFQAKYGFYFLYGALSVIYIVILFAIPENWKENASAILIFSDPAAMGLFFMGAIVLLEKNQHTPCAFAVSPVKEMEYVISKVVSLLGISLVVATILALVAGVNNLLFVLLGTALSSIIFTLLGVIVATEIQSLNQFIIYTVPVEIICFVPAVLHLFKITPQWFEFYPINICMDMVSGKAPSVIGLLIVVVLIACLLFASKKCVLKMWNSAGGAKL